jgi:hypothetical protein
MSDKKLKNIHTEDLIKELCSRGYLRVNPIYLTDDQLNDVVTFIENKWDANIGVSWDTIEFSIVNVLNL